MTPPVYSDNMGKIMH